VMKRMSINHCAEVDAYNYEEASQAQVISANSTTLGCEGELDFTRCEPELDFTRCEPELD